MTGDSLNYARLALEGKDLFHPHHLVFTAAVRVSYFVLGWLTGHWDVLLAAQLHNLAFLAFGLLAMFWIGWQRLDSAAVGWVGMVMWACTAGMMTYTTQVEVYVPAIACLAGATAVLLKERAGKVHLLFIALLWTSGVLYHQTSVLWAVPLFAYLQRKGRTLQAVCISALAGILTIIAYAAAFLAKGQKGLGFIEFCLYYVQHGSTTWGTTSNMGWEGLQTLANTQWRALSSFPGSPAILMGLALLISVLLFLAVRSWHLKTPEQNLIFFAFVWYVSYGLFFWWWLPSEIEFCVLMNLPLILATLAALANVKRLAQGRHPMFLVGPLAAVALASLLGSHQTMQTVVMPRHNDLGASYRSAENLYKASGEDCLVLARHRVFTAFRFYFSDVRSQSSEVTRAFQLVTTEQAHKVPRQNAPCVVLETRELLANRWFQGLNSYRAPDLWLDFLRWLFDATPCVEAESGLCAQSFVWTQSSNNGSAILKIGGEKEHFESLRAFLEHLAQSARASHPRLARDLERWIAAHPDLINNR